MISHGYRVTIRQGWNGQEHVIHSERNERIRLLLGQVTKDVTAIDSFEFEITPDQKQYANIHPFSTFIKVTRPDLDKTIFEGRVTTPNDEMDSDGTIFTDVICESLEGFLHDSVQPFAEFHNTTPKDFLQAIITNHNNQVEDYKKIKLGTVTVTNSTDNVYRFLEDDKSTYDNIQDKLISDLGGEIRIRNEPDGLYLDYEPEIDGSTKQKIELGKNLLSLQRVVDPTTLFTVLKPLGATQEPTDSSDSTNQDVSYPRLTIGGDGMIRDQSLINKFGVIVQAYNWDDVNVVADLKTKGQAMMDSQKNIKTQIQLTYVDLSHLGKNIDMFDSGNTVELVSSIHGLDMTERITGMVLNIVDIASSTMTIGEDDMNQSSYEAMNLAQANAANKALAKMINAQAQQLAQIKANSNTQYEELAKKNAELQAAIEQLEGKTSVGGAIIDVSEFQYTIDWTAVVKAGLALAVIRVQHGTSHEDLTYKANIPAAIDAGANYAVYAYNAAISVEDAKTEATNFYNRAQAAIGDGKQPRFWMIDVEEKTMTDMRSCISAYMDQLNSLGVPDNKIVLYIANHLYDSFNLDVSRAGSVWIPSYGQNDGTVAGSTKPTHPYDLWQYTSKGRIAGITQNTVDLSTDPSDRFKTNYLE